MEHPVIVVIGYNRKKSLKRLLKSLTQGIYPSNVKLIISIDKGGSPDVTTIANGFNWNHGEKEVIIHKKHLGLRNHVIKCGDLTQKYGSVILLEDDLYVSPAFYDYAVKALSYYQEKKNISGISLYSLSINMFTKLPFIPIVDQSDVFFLQIPASWGEVWSRDQWLEFKNWYEDINNEIIRHNLLHKQVINWPESSWAKYFWMYMVETNRFFVYPRRSLTTQFGEIGLHSKKKTKSFQVILQVLKQDYHFIDIEKSSAVYDSFYEVQPVKLNMLTNQFDRYDNYTVDLHGTKDLEKIRTKYVLTSKRCKRSIYSYGKELKPVEMNVINNIEGNQIQFALKKFVKETSSSRFIRKQQDFLYHHDISIKRMITYILSKILRLV
jgi:hypothetical protein